MGVTTILLFYKMSEFYDKISYYQLLKNAAPWRYIFQTIFDMFTEITQRKSQPLG
jgi:hypothetical protein